MVYILKKQQSTAQDTQRQKSSERTINYPKGRIRLWRKERKQKSSWETKKVTAKNFSQCSSRHNINNVLVLFTCSLFYFSFFFIFSFHFIFWRSKAIWHQARLIKECLIPMNFLFDALERWWMYLSCSERRNKLTKEVDRSINSVHTYWEQKISFVNSTQVSSIVRLIKSLWLWLVHWTHILGLYCLLELDEHSFCFIPSHVSL